MLLTHLGAIVINKTIKRILEPIEPNFIKKLSKTKTFDLEEGAE